MARVAVVGLGAIGTAVAGALDARGEHDVLLCTRRPISGDIRVEPEGGTPAVVRAARVSSTDGSAAFGADWILLAVKTYQTPSAASWLRRLQMPSSVIVPLQNGVEQIASVHAVSPEAHVLPAVVWIGSRLFDPHTAQVAGGAEIVVPDTETGAAFSSLLAGTYVGVRRANDFTTEAWRKLCTNAVAALEALVGRPAAAFRHAELRRLSRSLARECIVVGQAEGANIDLAYADDVVELLAALPEDTQASILVDRLADKPLEWDALVGVIRRIGSAHGIATPVADTVAALLEAASA